MIRRLLVLAAAGLSLAACGAKVSSATALHNWVTQSGFHDTSLALASDARHAVRALEDASTDPKELHLVCGVLLYDTESANASLPTPDQQSTSLLSRAYTDLGAGAHQCYNAGTSHARRRAAIESLRGGGAALAEATARIAVAS
ncbi:MAG: hypothetical protein KGJ92_01755 [Actinomycetales bacterium]|nr:hypothetical protein [Actinomycetales bacterium]